MSCAVLALIEKESGLLPRGRIDAEAETVLADLGRRLPFSHPLRLHRQLFDFPRRDVVLEPDAARLQLALQHINDERAQLLDAGVGDFDDEDVVIAIDDDSAEVIALGIDEAHAHSFRRSARRRSTASQSLADRLLGQHLIAERQRAQADLRMARMESRGDAAAARIVEIGDGGILRTALARDGAGENPGMAIGDEPLLARLQREDAAVGGFEWSTAANRTTYACAR